ncbi:MAG TPA: menaquinone biosynthesis protein, partial [Gemmatimonadaceae bacterium]|nr:menaquinone biosynthesis protein [Gemmatimonadaceae bacterium]
GSVMKIGRIPYINCYPVYGGIDRGHVTLEAELVDGVPTDLNRRMAAGELDISVVSAVEYARDSERYLLLPDLAISCDGPVRSVMLFSKRPASDLTSRRVIISRSSMTSVALLELLFESVWHCSPRFVPGDAEISDVVVDSRADTEARLVIGDAALVLGSNHREHYPYAYDLGQAWKDWTGQPFVFAVWVAQRSTDVKKALVAHAGLIASRNWGLDHLEALAEQAHEATGVELKTCAEYLSGLDYGLSYPHLAGLTEFYRRLVKRGRIPNGTLTFLPAA